MTPGTLDTLLVTVVGCAIGVAALGLTIYAIAAMVRRMRAPAPANVIQAPPQQVVVGLMCLLLAALFAAIFARSHEMSRGAMTAAIAIVAVFTGISAILLLRGVRWRLAVEPEGLVHRGILGSRRVSWADIRCLSVLPGGAILCVLRPRGNIVVLANAPNIAILLPAARSAGVMIELL
jgi:hypothetical protein